MQYQCIFFGFANLYAVMVCVACSQLEKLTAKLSDIEQKRFTSEDDSIRECNNNENGELVSISNIKKTLKECVQLHQLIIRYVYAAISSTIDTKKQPSQAKPSQAKPRQAKPKF
jgi:hypothetical protein